MTGQPPPRPKLSDPATPPRHHKTGRQDRAKPIFAAKSELPSSSLLYWEVEVTPLVGASSTGRGFDAEEQLKRGVQFEVRALYYGTGLPEFGSQPNTRLVPQIWEDDRDLAVSIARRWTELIRSGLHRDLDLLVVANDVKGQRAGA